jgi:predicted transposase YbfD/YdcC
VFSLLWPDEFQTVLLRVAEALHEELSGGIISIDGKVLRGSFDEFANQKRIHTVSAYSADHGVTLAMVSTLTKSNEITAIPELLDLIDVQGAVVTLDAMGCQTAIVSKIIEKGGDYVISLKGNQGTLHKAVEEYFSETSLEYLQELKYSSVLYTTEKGHGRVEERAYVIVNETDWIPGISAWKGLNSIGMVITKRTVGDKPAKEERRHYICSIRPDVELFEKASRGHWAIENESHHVLDVTFKEDQSRIRRDNAPENMAIIRRLANGLLKNEKSANTSTPRKQMKANRSIEYLLKVLKSKIPQNDSWF